MSNTYGHVMAVFEAELAAALAAERDDTATLIALDPLTRIADALASIADSLSDIADAVAAEEVDDAVDIGDVITDITPTETPFMRAVREGDLSRLAFPYGQPPGGIAPSWPDHWGGSVVQTNTPRTRA